jgi:hypothetical protein
MDAPFGFIQVEAMFFGSIDDRAQGDLLSVGFAQAVLEIAIIIRL